MVYLVMLHAQGNTWFEKKDQGVQLESPFCRCAQFVRLAYNLRGDSPDACIRPGLSAVTWYHLLPIAVTVSQQLSTVLTHICLGIRELRVRLQGRYGCRMEYTCQ